MKSDDPISFKLDKRHAEALRALGGGRKVRVMGTVAGDQVRVDFVACNAAFVACNAAFNACNAAFNACNSPFSKD